MMRGMASTMEQHHKVQILDEALEASVKLSHRYIPARQLPDKSVSLLDTACARVAISQHSVPPEVDDCRKRIAALENELAIIYRETAVGVETAAREAIAAENLGQEQAHLAEIEERWKQEKVLVERILVLRAQLRGAIGTVEGTDTELGQAADQAAAEISVQTLENLDTAQPINDIDRAALLAELKELQNQLHAMQGDHPLILPTVDHQAVASVVESWTGIPVGRMVKNEVESILKLADTLEQRIIGQRHALDMIARRIQTSR